MIRFLLQTSCTLVPVLVLLSLAFCSAQQVKKYTDKMGTVRTYFQGKLHSCQDEPALVTSTGSREWYKNGNLHRKGNPARILPDGSEEWYLEGKLHRERGPAIHWKNGWMEWWKHGKKHRKRKPAVIKPDGTKMWYWDGNLHRPRGPAIAWTDGNFAYFKHGAIHRGWNKPAVKTGNCYDWYVRNKHIQTKCENPAMVEENARVQIGGTRS